MVLHTFTGAATDGAYPNDSLTASGSVLYGMSDGGAHGSGEIFQFNTSNNSFTQLYSFKGPTSDGNQPYGNVTQIGNVLYGMTYGGGTGSGYGGTIFDYNLGNGAEAVLHNFSGPPDGESPYGSFTASGTTLYSTTYYGGSSANGGYGYGTIFSFNTTNNSESVLHTTSGGAGDSSFPVGTMVLSGNTLYGMSFEGGSTAFGYGYGALFAFNTSTNTQRVIHVFTGGTSDGNYPNGSVILSGSDLYGMTPDGGAYGDGVIFDYNISTSSYKILYSFRGGTVDGDSPLGSLTQVGNILYGSTVLGGAHNDGTIFQYNLTTGFESLLHSFNGADGQALRGSLTLSGSSLYGLATYGGADGDGVLFSLPAATLTWNNSGATGNGVNWDIGANQNWNNSTAATTYSDGSNVIFNDGNNSHDAVSINSTVAPASVVISNSSGNYDFSGSGSIAGATSLTKNGSSSLTLSMINSYTGGTVVNAGTLISAVSGALPQGQPLAINGSGLVRLATGTGAQTLSSLSFSGNGTLDIGNNHVFVAYGGGIDPVASIAAWIKSGYAGGGWNGPGIISSAARTTTNGLLYGIGYADGKDGKVSGLSSGQIEVMYTLPGDANLDGLVNGADFTILAANFNQPVHGWDQGDFNYDGLVNAADFTDLAANFNQSVSGAAVSGGDIEALDAFAAANGLPLPTFANVPEPASVGMIVMAGFGILRRRRRSSRQANVKAMRAAALQS
jgi:uncharacterized repeat protein (TIGR03803 family)/autotransporter-associated beta strand protein